MKRFTDIRKLSDNKFLNLYKMDALSENGREFDYYFVSRHCEDQIKIKTRMDTAEGVVIYPIWQEDPGKIVLIRQYRYPLDAYVYELPAGLIDEGEDAAQAAVREMKEETGFELTVYDGGDAALRRPFYMGAGFTDESSQTVFGYASGKRSCDFKEDTESIQVLLADRKEARRILKEERVSLRCAFLLMNFLQSEAGNPFGFLKSGNEE